MSKMYAPDIKDPIVLSDNRRDNILNYDEKNEYPQRIKRLITESKTACKAVIRMAENIECDGFVDQAFGDLENDNGRRMNDVLKAVASDLAYYNGAYLIVQYYANGAVKSVYNEPFENVRICLNEQYKVDAKIRTYRVFNNWERKQYLDKDVEQMSIDYPVFNPDTVLSEIKAHGGIENYNGQIFAIKSSVYDAYPLSPFHAVQPEMYTEQANSKSVMQKLAKGFHSNFLIEHGTFATDEERDGFREAFSKMRGYENTGNGLLYENANMDVRGIFMHNIGTPLSADDYKAYSEPIANDICIAANGLPIGLIDTSKIQGSNVSGNTIKELRSLYRDSLLSYRNLVSRSFAKIFGLSEIDFLIDDKLNQNATNY